MFIMNELNAGEMLAELLKGGRVSSSATKEFANYRHDLDLCPRFSGIVSTMLEAYKAFGQEVHDIQSCRDDGVDVLMRYVDKEGNERRAGLQIKSEDEFRKWEKKQFHLIQLLKAQAGQAVANVRLDEFYVVLCVDASRHQRRIRTLCSEMKNFRPCEIIEPVDVLATFQMSSLDIWARTTRMLCRNDVILEAATAECDGYEPDLSFFMVSLLCRAFQDKIEVSDSLLFEIWCDWEQFAGEFASDSNRLSDMKWELDETILAGEAGAIQTIEISRLPKALCALYFDLSVRTNEPADDIRDTILALVELKSRLGPDEDE